MNDIFISILSGVLGALIGAFFSWRTLKFNYKQLFAENISKSRMEWINNFREDMSIVIATIKYPYKNERNEEYNKIRFEAEKARARLLTRLNQDITKDGNEYNCVLADKLSSICFRCASAKCKKLDKQLIELTRKILEPEWQRVKREAKGKS